MKANDVWSNMLAWNLVLPPNRPNHLNLNLLKLTIGNRERKERVCILGSTPEYRQILRRHFPQITIIDNSQEFFEISSGIVGKHYTEEVIFKDWLTALVEYEESFDIILSHYTHGNISYNDRAKFFGLISKALKPDGIFFDCVFQPIDLFSQDDIERKFKNALPNLRAANDLNCIGVFQGQHIEENGLIDTQRAYEWLEQANFSPSISNVIKLTKSVTPPDLKWYYSPKYTPETLGYLSEFKILSSLDEHHLSPFYGAVRHIISKKVG